MKEKPIYEQLGYEPDPPFYSSTSTPIVTNYDTLIRKSPEELAAWISDHPVTTKYDENNPQHKAWLGWLQREATSDV